MSRTVNPWLSAVLLALLVIGACGDTASSGGSVNTLRPGQCFSVPPAVDVISEVLLVPCEEPHNQEVVGSYELALDHYPGDLDLQPMAYKGCQPAFEQHLGVPFWDSEFDIRTITPSPSTWDAGDRTVVCLVVNMTGTALFGSLRDVRR